MQKNYLLTTEIVPYLKEKFDYEITESSVGQWRSRTYKGNVKGPKFYRHGYKQIRYKIADVDAWAAEMGLTKC